MFLKVLLLSTAVSSQTTQPTIPSERSLLTKEIVPAPTYQGVPRELPFNGSFDKLTVDNITEKYGTYPIDHRLGITNANRSQYVSIIPDSGGAYAKLTVDNTSVFEKNNRHIFRTDLLNFYRTGYRIQACATYRKEDAIKNGAEFIIFVDESHKLDIRLNNATNKFVFYNNYTQLNTSKGAPVEVEYKLGEWRTFCFLAGGTSGKISILHGKEKENLHHVITYGIKEPLISKDVTMELHWGTLQWQNTMPENLIEDSIDMRGVSIQFNDPTKNPK